jgi:predicted  nucleic acid-binding Zn-ribbon protein
MKTALLIVFSFLAIVQAKAQYTVIDPTSISVIQNSNIEQLQQWASQLQKMDQQFNQLNQQLTQLQTLNQNIGSPTAVAGDINTVPLNGIINSTGVSQSLQTIDTGANGATALKQDSLGLYQPVSTTTPSGNCYTPNTTEYKPYAALQTAQDNFTTVVQTNMPQMQQLMAQIQDLQTQAKTATTESEVQKIQTQLQVAQTAYSNLQGQITTAAQQVTAQKAANDSDQQKQDQANSEKMTTDLNQEMQQLSTKLQPPQLQQ